MSLEYIQNEQFQQYEFPVSALNGNHPAGHLLPRHVHYDHCHVYGRNWAAILPPSRPLSW